MDNRIFNVNGRTKEQLTLAVKSLLLNEYGQNQKVNGWYFRKDKGLVLCWHIKEKNHGKLFTDRMGNPKPIEVDELVDLLWEWLSSDEADTVEPADWEDDLDHDGDNENGWRLYTEEWG